MKKFLHLLTFIIFLLAVLLSIRTVKFPKAADAVEQSKLPLEKIKLHDGFEIQVYADEVKNARSMSLSPNGTLFVGTRSDDKVYALIDSNQDHKVDKRYVIASGLNTPNGVAFLNGDLYVAEINRILKYPSIEENLDNPPKPVVIRDDFPKDNHHGWKYIAFGPDNMLYVPVGAPCNVCERSNKIYSSITRIDPSGKGDIEIYAHGVRNTVGFTWHPDTKDLWFTDNGRDWMGDDMPACELNYAPKKDLHFGFPYCHQGDTPDPKFGGKRSCNEFISPVQNLGPHVAPLGMEFYTGTMFPDEYKNQVLIAEHGSWNRSKRIGYRVMLVELEGNKSISYKPFADGWLENEEVWGRPVDLEILPDGSVLVSDDHANAIYRISYSG